MIAEEQALEQEIEALRIPSDPESADAHVQKVSGRSLQGRDGPI